MARLRAVFFDVGETLVDETREYGTWADWLGVARHTFSAVFGAVIARGGDHRETFQYFKPGFDLAAERDRRAAAGRGGGVPGGGDPVRRRSARQRRQAGAGRRYRDGVSAAWAVGVHPARPGGARPLPVPVGLPRRAARPGGQVQPRYGLTTRVASVLRVSTAWAKSASIQGNGRASTTPQPSRARATGSVADPYSTASCTAPAITSATVMSRELARRMRALRAAASCRGRPSTIRMFLKTPPDAMDPKTPRLSPSSRSATACARSCGTRHLREYDGSTATTPSLR